MRVYTSSCVRRGCVSTNTVPTEYHQNDNIINFISISDVDRSHNVHQMPRGKARHLCFDFAFNSNLWLAEQSGEISTHQ